MRYQCAAAAAQHDARRLGSIDASHTHTYTLSNAVFIKKNRFMFDFATNTNAFLTRIHKILIYSIFLDVFRHWEWLTSYKLKIEPKIYLGKLCHHYSQNYFFFDHLVYLKICGVTTTWRFLLPASYTHQFNFPYSFR